MKPTVVMSAGDYYFGKLVGFGIGLCILGMLAAFAIVLLPFALALFVITWAMFRINVSKKELAGLSGVLLIVWAILSGITYAVFGLNEIVSASIGFVILMLIMFGLRQNKKRRVTAFTMQRVPELTTTISDCETEIFKYFDVAEGHLAEKATVPFWDAMGNADEAFNLWTAAAEERGNCISVYDQWAKGGTNSIGEEHRQAPNNEPLFARHKPLYDTAMKLADFAMVFEQRKTNQQLLAAQQQQAQAT